MSESLTREALRLNEEGIPMPLSSMTRAWLISVLTLLPKLAWRVEELEADNAALREILFKPK